MAVLVMVGLAAAKVVRSVRRRIGSQRRAHRAHLAAAAVSAVSHVDGVMWLEHERPFAYSIAGKPGLVVASTGLNRMPAGHREAVLHHERHHLRHRHHWLVLAAEAARDALPRIPLFRAAAGATRTLTELSADRGAARLCGTEAVAAALVALGNHERSAGLRLVQLRPAGRAGLWRHVVACLTSGALPAVLGGALVGAVITLVC